MHKNVRKKLTITKSKLHLPNSEEQRPSFVRYNLDFTFNFHELIYLVVVGSTPMSHILYHMNLVSEYGGTIVAPLHMACLLCIALPLMVMYHVLGCMSRKSFIQFWDICPMLRGTTVCVLIALYYNIIINVAYVSLFLMCLVDSMTLDLPMNKCAFEGASPDCIPNTRKENYTEECCVDVPITNCYMEFRLSYHEYYSTYYFADASWPVKKPEAYFFRMKYAAYTFSLWLAIFGIIMIGIKRYKQCIHVLFVVYGFGLVLFAIFTVYLSWKYLCPNIYVTHISTLLNPQLWLDILIHSIFYERPGELIYLGCYANVNIEPFSAAFLCYFLKLFILNLCSSWVSLSLTFIQRDYKVHDEKCLRSRGRDVIFALIPELLSRSFFPQFFLFFYYTFAAFWTIQSVLVKTSITVNTILLTFPKLKKFKFFVGLIFVSIGCFVNLSLQFYASYKTFYVWKRSGYWLLCVFCCGAIILAIALYSVQRLLNDYHFMYGREVKRYWLYGYKIAMFVCCIGFALFLVFSDHAHLLVHVEDDEPAIKIGVIILNIASVTPIFIGMIIVIIRSFVKRQNLALCLDSWGSPDPEILQLRRNFYPQKKTRFFYPRVLCKHNCLLYSPKLKAEQDYMTEKQNLLENIWLEKRLIREALRREGGVGKISSEGAFESMVEELRKRYPSTSAMLSASNMKIQRSIRHLDKMEAQREGMTF